MDTTRIELIGKQLDKIVDSVAQHPTGLLMGEVALLAAAIGASAAILSQVVIFLAQTLVDIRLFNPRKASDFSEIMVYEELPAAETKEEGELNKVYLHFSECFDRINIEMSKKI